MLFLLLILFTICHSGAVRVQVEQGWLEGEQLETVTGDRQYYSFKGIPYAAPPIGTLRFKSPVPAVPWQGIKNATQHGPVCVQYDYSTGELIPSSEDCLTINVYTPSLSPSRPLPVMFFIHGGGYKTDSGNVDNYGPDFLVEHDVIVVTFNYRLDVLGFLCLDTIDVPGNAGMKDQVEALKWVNKNIRKFGGDLENITIFGQSAGGASIIFHMISPLSRGLFKRAISMSGVPSCDWSIAYEPRRRAFVLGNELGIDTNDPAELLEFLQNLPAEQLVNRNPSVLTSEQIIGNSIKMFPFTPVEEKNMGVNHFITNNALEAFKKGQFHDVDMMIGRVTNEGILDLPVFENNITAYSKYVEMIVPREIIYAKEPNKILKISDMINEYYFKNKPLREVGWQQISNYITDCSYSYNIYRFIKQFSKMTRRKLYVYKFSCVSDRNIYAHDVSEYGVIGATHLDDTAYLFDPKRANLSITKDSKEYKMVKQVCALFTNFAKYGNPTPDNSLGSKWPAYDDTIKGYLDIGETLATARALDSDAVAFWKSIYDEAKIEF